LREAAGDEATQSPNPERTPSVKTPYRHRDSRATLLPMSDPAFQAKVRRVAEQATAVADMLANTNQPDLKIDPRVLKAALDVAKAMPSQADALTIRQALKSIHAEFYAAHSANLGAAGDPELLQLDQGLEIILGRLTAVVDSSEADWISLAPDDLGHVIDAAPHAEELADLRLKLDASIAAMEAVEVRLAKANAQIAALSGPQVTFSPLPPFVSVSVSTAKIKELVERMLLSGQRLSGNRLGAAAGEVKLALDSFEATVAREREKLEQFEGLHEAATTAVSRSRVASQGVDVFIQHAFIAPKPGPPPNPWPDLKVFRDIDEPWCPEMVVIPAGEFLMGSPKNEPERDDDEGPQVRVRIGKFALGVYAVTFEEYDAFCEDTGRELPADEGWGRGRRPAINVSWLDAQAYYEWLSDKVGAEYRLPSEAEWEYACRAGTDTPFWWGSTISPEQANYDGTYDYNGGVKGKWRKQTLPVDAFEVNPWGLYQVYGNVDEWCEDDWSNTHEDVPRDGAPRILNADRKIKNKVLRGGSWGDFPRLLRSAARDDFSPVNRGFFIGFRVARTLTS